jgi:hypothetical protein
MRRIVRKSGEPLNSAHAIEHAPHRGSGGEGAAGGGLNRRAIGEGIGKRHAEFHHVRAGAFEREHQLHGRFEARIAARQVGDEAGAAFGLQAREAGIDAVGSHAGAITAAGADGRCQAAAGRL